MKWDRESAYCITSGPWVIAWYYTGETVHLKLSKAGQEIRWIHDIPRGDDAAKRRALEQLKTEATNG